MTNVLGLPGIQFLSKAWSDEPLTRALVNVDLSQLLSEPCNSLSLVSKQGGQEIAQCSCNRLQKYWSHVERIDSQELNRPSEIFLKIQQLDELYE